MSPGTRTARSSGSLRVAAYNVNGVNGRLPRLLEWLRETAPDVVCLQELKTDDTRFPGEALRKAGYGAVWHGQRAHHGVAILARDETPREVRRGLPGDDKDGQARYLEAEAKGLRIASVYLPNGNPVPSPNFDYKLAWFARFIRYARKLCAADAPALIAGDLNVIPTDFDIYNPGWWRFDAVMQPQTRDAFRQLLAQGWMDVARECRPSERNYTFWTTDRAYRQNHGMRLDFLLANPVLRPNVVATGVDAEYRGRERPSDHAPLWVTLRQ